LYDNTEYIIIKGFTWNDINIDELNCLAIVRDPTIMSLRDLNQKHLNMLISMREDILKVLENKYALTKNKLRLFVHYQPTFYHLHIHIITTQSTSGYSCGKVHFLDEIISNLSLFSTYYEESTLVYEIKENSKFAIEFARTQ
jgi:m7GpppX diphosphatase